MGPPTISIVSTRHPPGTWRSTLSHSGAQSLRCRKSKKNRRIGEKNGCDVNLGGFFLVNSCNDWVVIMNYIMESNFMQWFVIYNDYDVELSVMMNLKPSSIGFHLCFQTASPSVPSAGTCPN